MELNQIRGIHNSILVFASYRRQPPFRHKFIWKLKIPLKIKIFLWYLQRGIILTKDNLARKNWTGSQKYCGCNSNETINHLFLDCHYARMVWRVIFLATGLTPPRSISQIFSSWLSNQYIKIRQLIWVGVAAVCWAIWRSRNDIVFNRTIFNLIMQVIFRGHIGYIFGRSCSVTSRPGTHSPH